ncbi:ABC transporter ATP-binding protein [Halobacterium jilantaiense]|uniref:ABC-2 type transport system ATP-binding protein n=1 Tax=Halobacterium jilantaiense TaxID=355548 RepID=A0A1I0QFU7_9EURY|nr:ABC transporter ATP-binding protein [Halobacterium jilantaiense]SEW25976.1 ABC-2 type transport system ATP-binding protein [Halobacterium jilantaiense]
MAVIEVDSLTKRYGDLTAVDDASFGVEAGEVFGFLGPNGAGKTTTIRTLLGMQSPTSGGVAVLGHDTTVESERLEALADTGFLPSNPQFDEQATGREILDLHESIKGGGRRAELLDLFDPPLDRKIREYSTGNVQKLGVVQAFMHDPEVVVMDEPTSGLDPLLQARFNDFLRAERDRGVTALFSSHVLSEVRRVCDRVAVIRDGRLVAVEDVQSLLDRSGKVVRARVAGDLPADAFDLPGVSDLTMERVDGATRVSLTYTGGMDALVDELDRHSLLELDVEEAPLEDVFLQFYGGDSSA